MVSELRLLLILLLINIIKKADALLLIQYHIDKKIRKIQDGQQREEAIMKMFHDFLMNEKKAFQCNNLYKKKQEQIFENSTLFYHTNPLRRQLQTC